VPTPLVFEGFGYLDEAKALIEGARVPREIRAAIEDAERIIADKDGGRERLIEFYDAAKHAHALVKAHLARKPAGLGQRLDALGRRLVSRVAS
jgi:hypothetical protein